MHEISMFSLWSSHCNFEFRNGKSFFFMVFESQAKDCLESSAILMGTALKFITFNLPDIFCNEK